MPEVAAAAFAIEEWDPQAATDEQWQARYELSMLIQAEQEPEDPPERLDQWRESVLRHPSWVTNVRWAGSDREGRLVGTAHLSLGYKEENRHLAFFGIAVHPGSRRRGIATHLTARIVERAAADGRRLLQAWAPEGSPGAAFLGALGAECKLTERKSSLHTARLDRALLEGWVTRAAERAPGYSLVGFDDRCPDELLAPWVELTHVMNTAPRGELDMQDWRQTPEMYRENEERYLSQGYRGWTLIARRDADGTLAGFTELSFDPRRPWLAWQGGTAVRPEHRSLGLGRWLKAAMALRLLDQRPEVARVDTGNAFVNKAMLDINIAMGFELVRGYGEWQVPVETALAYSQARLA